MNAHNRLLKRQAKNVLTLVDLKQLAMQTSHPIIDEHEEWEGQHVYRVLGDVGLWTFDELKKRFLH